MPNSVLLEKLAYNDELTGLKNRNYLLKEFEERDLQNQHFIFVDIDEFKNLNTVFGSEVVDNMLIVMTKTLKDYCGKSDVYRVGGGQFVLVTESHIICEPIELKKILIQPIMLDDMQMLVDASICVLAHDDFPSTTISEVLKFMQLMINETKKMGKNQLLYLDQEKMKSYQEKKTVAYNLVKGVKNKEFRPKFQPFVDTYTNEIIGFEAVSRWYLNGDMLRPRCYLDAAEKTGLIYDIELQIFEEAVQFLRELKDNKEIKLSKRFKAAVHFSAHTLKRVDILDLLAVLKRYKILATDIIIETQEKFIMDEEAFEKINSFSSNNFMVLLDEYTNNNASLTFLADLRIDVMKLSETLIERIDNDEEYTKMMNVYKFLVDIARKFEISVVSDGIKTKKNAKMVKELDVHIGIGEFYSKAITKEEFIEFTKSNKSKR